MAIVFRGLDSDELSRWTAQMIASGTRADLSGLDRPTVDKHSTGGVGDKISLVLCPLVAACGAAVPQTAGRGLGHTGGTLDKMECIPGWRSTLSPDEVLAILADTGAVINAAGPDLAPADRKLYALRDVTGTVESIPLIASSIMSKKIAGGHRGARARREGRQRRVHEGRRAGARAGRDDGRPGRRPRRPHHGVAHADGRPARAHGRQRAGGRSSPSRCWPAVAPRTSSS